eukprot:163182_1
MLNAHASRSGHTVFGVNKLGFAHSIMNASIWQLQRRSLKVAVIGGSMSGLFTARSLLPPSTHDIHIFERTTDTMTGGGLTVTTPMIDASKSHDYKGDPCVKFVWDFGDGTPTETTTQPQTHHPYAKPSTYPVSVQVFDKNGKSARAGINQRVSDPSVTDSDPSGGKGPKQKTNAGRRGQGAPRDTDPVGNTFNSTG